MAKFLKTTDGSRLINAQPKAQKLFRVSKTNINSHFKATAKAQYKANYKPIRGKIATGAAAVLAVVTIGKFLPGMVNVIILMVRNFLQNMIYCIHNRTNIYWVY